MRPVVRKEEEVETGADRADEAQGGGCWIENVLCGWREWKESKTRRTGSNVLSGDNHDKTKQDKQAKHAAQPRLPVSPSSALRTWICCCYRATCSAVPACTECGSKKRSAVFGTSVTEPRSRLDPSSTRRTLSSFNPIERTKEQYHPRQYQYLQTRQHNPTQTPTSTIHCAATARPLPFSPPATSPRQNRNQSTLMPPTSLKAKHAIPHSPQ